MQALKIGSAFGSGAFKNNTLRPAYTVRKPALEHETTYDTLGVDYDLEDELEPEPALTSDDATAPSSSRPPSPSLSPIDDSSYIDVISSSPIRDSFFRPYKRRMTLEEKPGMREDVAAALLSLALPRVGVSPLASTFPVSPPHRSESPTMRAAKHTADLDSEAAVPTPSSDFYHSSAGESQLNNRALIDLPVEAQVDVKSCRAPTPIQLDEASWLGLCLLNVIQ
jgi:hypothetical protein